ncbi:MAG: DUF1588 domain-containing protein [Myxococcota bacterium]
MAGTRFFALLAGSLFACTGTVSSPSGSGGVNPDRDPIVDEEVVETRLGWPGVPGTVLQGVSRLTPREIHLAVGDLVGTPIEEVPFPADQTGHFTNDSSTLDVSPLFFERALEVAKAAASIATANVSCGDDKAACFQEFVHDFVARAWRRPVAEAEVGYLRAVFDRGLITSDERAIEMVAIAALVSVPFLFREDVPDDDGKLDSYAIAERLSFFLWDTVPDEELWAAAVADDLGDPNARWAQAERMMRDPRFVSVCVAFHRELFEVDELAAVAKLPSSYPEWTDSVAQAAADELGWLFAELCTNDGGLAALLSTRASRPAPELADVIYGIDAPGDAPIELPELRAGVLARAGFLALHGVEQSRPVLRGKQVRERLLCDEVPQPPTTAEATPPSPADDDQPQTTRNRFAAATAGTSCEGCHQLMNPIGFAFEHFDTVGRYRAEDADVPVDATGEAVMSDLAPFDGLGELQSELAGSRLASACYLRQWFRQALARSEVSREIGEIETMSEPAFGAPGYRHLVEALVRSDAFATRVIEP